METPQLKWNEAGLVTVVAQDRETGEIRMVAHANQDALQATLETGKAHFFSRSRQALWCKGETSGHTLYVHEVWSDCDGDALLYMVDPQGPSCHTGKQTCFFTQITDTDGALASDMSAEASAKGAAPTLLKLARVLESRSNSSAKRSYTKSLLDKGAAQISAKLREEAGELGEAIQNETDDRVLAESGDVLYHLMVGLLLRRLPIRGLLKELSNRFGVSGHEEKASRPN